jgi:hypothetical protein
MGRPVDSELRLVLGTAATDDTALVDLLEADAPRRLAELDLADLEPWIDDLASLDLHDRPDAALLVATLLHRLADEPTRAAALARSARDAYDDRGDHDGVVQAGLLLGYIAWRAGDLGAANEWWDQTGGLPADRANPPGLAPFRAAADLIADGHLRRAVPDTHHAYAITVAEGSVIDEANATVLSGLVTMDTGAYDRATEMLERADDLYSEITSPGDAALWPLVALGLGEIAARRGQVDRALAHFAAAGRRGVDVRRPALTAVAEAFPALHLSHQAPGDLLTPARAALAVLQDDQAHWFARQLAERAVATASLATGDPETALELAEATAATVGNVMLRAKTLVLVAAARRALGRPGVAEALDEAIATFLDEGADLWAVEALLQRADLDPAQASPFLELAHTHTGDDVAFERLWRQRPRFVVELSGTRRPVFRLGSQVLALGAKGERLAEAVVRAGDAGTHWETVAARLWPDEDDAERIKSRLTSLTALVRGRLGPDGWRLRRDGPRFRFISIAAEVVILTDDVTPRALTAS